MAAADPEARDVHHVTFSVLSEAEIRRMAVVKCHDPALYRNGLPVLNSVVDARLGSVDRRFVCSTCKHSIGKGCPGHFGMIELAVPCFNPALLEPTLNILRSVCYFCSRMLLPATATTTTATTAPRKRKLLSKMALAGKGVHVCPHCHGCQPSYCKSTSWILCDFSGVPRSGFADDVEVEFVSKPFTAETALSILRNITDEDSEALGFPVSEFSTRPSSFIMTVMLVPGNTMRPSSSVSDSKGHDDLTRALQEIVKRNNALERAIGTGSDSVDKAAMELQQAITQYIMNNAKTPTGVPQGAKRKRAVVEGPTRCDDQLTTETEAGETFERSEAGQGDQLTTETETFDEAGRGDDADFDDRQEGERIGQSETDRGDDQLTTETEAGETFDDRSETDPGDDISEAGQGDERRNADDADDDRSDRSGKRSESGRSKSTMRSTTTTARARKRRRKMLRPEDQHFPVPPPVNPLSHAPPNSKPRHTIACGLAQRLKGKRGRLRLNVTGKRTDFSSRGVISPDPNIALDEVGVPEYVAKKQTIPERVTQFNKSELQKLILARKANFLRAPHLGDNMINLQRLSEERLRAVAGKLAIGWVVERHLKNGDHVLFNRQPSLHAYSLMSHRVRIQKNKVTFSLNPQCTHPYNADFDGDEMNMHVLQSLTARAEAAELMAVSRNMISAQNSTPSLGMIQDAVVGLWFLTCDGCEYPRNQVMQLVLAADDESVVADRFADYDDRLTTEREAGETFEQSELNKRSEVGEPCDDDRLRETFEQSEVDRSDAADVWTGKQIFSLLLPDDFNFDRSGVKVVQGQMVAGRLTKKALGGGPGGFIDILARDYPPEVAVDFVTRAQRLALAVLQTRSFSAGFGDMFLPEDVNAKVRREFDRIRNVTAKSFAPRDEDRATERLRDGVSTAGAHACANVSSSNGLWTMIESGSKGSKINFAQITAGVGVQMVAGGRVFATSDPARRTLPCFQFGDHGPFAHGFVESSYRTGLQPDELFMHVKAGREGLVDTAVKTAQTGYLNRRVVKMVETTVSDARGRVMLSSGEVIQPFYGGDGFDPTKIENVPCSALGMTDDELRAELGGRLTTEIVWSIDFVHRARRAQLRHCDIIRTILSVPVNVTRLLDRQDYRQDYRRGDDRSCGDWLQKFDALARKLVPPDQVLAQSTPLDSFRFHLIWETRHRGFTMPKDVFEQCVRRLHGARLPAGYPPGIIASQSSSQLSTQNTLNSFHSTGQSHTLVNTGMPRYCELLYCTVDIMAPLMSVPVQTSSEARALAARLPFLSLAQVVVGTPEINRDDDADERSEVEPTERPGDGDADEIRRTREVYRALDDGYGGGSDGGWTVVFRLRRPGTSNLPTARTSEVARAMRRFFDDRREVTTTRTTTGRDDGSVYVMATANYSVLVCLDDFSFVGNKGPATADEVAKFADDLLTRVVIRGLRGITSAEVQTNTRTDALTGQPVTSASVLCGGINFRDLAWIPEVDVSQVTMNHVIDVYNLLGIEAAVVTLYQETSAVVGAENISHRHLYLIIDTMTHDGFVNAISRHGLSKTTASPLQRASFEEAMDVLMEAAVYNAESDVTGVTECVVLGTPSTIGTGAVKTRSLTETKPLVAVSRTAAAATSNIADFKFVGRRRSNVTVRPVRRVADTRRTQPVNAPVISGEGTLLVQCPDMIPQGTDTIKIEVHFQCHSLFSVQVLDDERTQTTNEVNKRRGGDERTQTTNEVKATSNEGPREGVWKDIYNVADESKIYVRQSLAEAVQKGSIRVQLLITNNAVSGRVKGSSPACNLSRQAHNVHNMKQLVKEHRVRIKTSPTSAATQAPPLPKTKLEHIRRFMLGG